MNNYLPIIGMEIHVELKTKSKMFCGCKNDPFHAPKPNIYTCPVCLGLPGALPVPNKKAVEWTIMLGLALSCEIQLLSKFDRKNYFYPDLPKGYQISQYDQPLARHGWLEIPNLKSQITKRIRINRVHLEEDTGKLLHQTINGRKMSLVDFNRSGVPLVEIVTEPDIHSSEEARIFLKKLHQIVRYLNISDADMEKGSMRLEPNISVQEISNLKSQISNKSKIQNPKLPDYKVEVKNINSFKFVAKAIDYEVARHITLLEKGETPVQETRGWEEKKGVTLPQRSKEEAHDYRYFPEPDIPPMRWISSQLTAISDQIPELPDTKLTRFIKDYQLSEVDAERITETREMAEYFEESVERLASNVQINIKPKDLVNWLLNKKVDTEKVTPEELIKQIVSAKTVVQVDEEELKKVIEKVLSQNTKAVSDYKSGKIGVIMFLVGACMRELRGKGDAMRIRKQLERNL